MYNKQLYVIILLFLSIYMQKCGGLPADICYGTEDVQFLPHPDSCLQYILCILGTPTVLDCPIDQIFDPVTLGCEPGNPETCELFTFTTISTTSPILTETEPQSTSEPEEPEPTTTEYFTDSPTAQETTTGDISTSTTSRLMPTTTPIPVHRCPPSGFGYIPHHTNCSRYFECIAGIRHLRFCPYDFLFDSVTLQCTYPELAVCAGHH